MRIEEGICSSKEWAEGRHWCHCLGSVTPSLWLTMAMLSVGVCSGALQSGVVSHSLPLVVPLLESSLKAERSEEICDTARLKNLNSEVKFQIKCLLGAKCAAWLRAVAAHRPRSEHRGRQGCTGLC